MELIKISLEDLLNTLFQSSEIKEFLYISKELAKKRGEFLYFAGGIPRDYLLKKFYNFNIETAKDLDLVLQGDLQGFLSDLFAKIRGKIIFKSQFLTYKAKIIANKKEFIVDFITARKEIYEDVAKLPKVFPSNFKDDVLRRDFTINTLIIGLSPPYEGVLIDLVEGKKDLEKKIIKPLHLNSFVDDPTRAFRGIRYKIRFNFDFAEEFLIALKEAFKKEAFKKLTPARIINELKLYLYKEPAENLLKLLETTYYLEIFKNAQIKVKKEKFDLIKKILNQVEKEIKEKEREKFYLLSIVDPDHLESLSRLGFTAKEIEDIKRYLEKIKSFLKVWEKLSLWEKIKILEKIPLPYLLALSAYFSEIEKDVIEYIKKYRKIKPKLTGNDIMKLGIKNGKKIGEILELLRRQKIEDKLKTKEEEEEFVYEILLKRNKN